MISPLNSLVGPKKEKRGKKQKQKQKPPTEVVAMIISMHATNSRRHKHEKRAPNPCDNSTSFKLKCRNHTNQCFTNVKA